MDVDDVQGAHQVLRWMDTTSGDLGIIPGSVLIHYVDLLITTTSYGKGYYYTTSTLGSTCGAPCALVGVLYPFPYDEVIYQ